VEIVVQRVAVVKFRMNDGSGDSTGSFEVKIKTKTAKFTNMITARFREMVKESVINVACTIWPKIGLGHET